MNLSKIGRVRNDGRWHSRGSDWATPHELFNELNKEFNFTLDVCASDWNKKCENYFNEEQDGLKQDWGKKNSAILAEFFVCFCCKRYSGECR